MKTLKHLILFTAGMVSATLALGQTNLNFTAISATVEGAIRFSWNSTTNEFYEIDYADSLVDTNTGFITWMPLYSDYPSHGTNTFIADGGNYDVVPEIVHPKYSPMRFYRIVLSGTNSSPTNPIVSITAPTNGTSLSGTMTVSVSSSSPELITDTRLFVDGEEMWTSDDGTNFVINTCEWPNGAHVLFAVARSQSGLPGIPEDHSVTYGRAASAYVNVTFDNLITRYDFSQPFFEPALGQTQRVSAIFAAGVDWTLAIQDASTNTIRFSSGSGAKMQFDWDGTGTNGVSLPDGPYTYLLSAATNGQTYSEDTSTNAGGGSPPGFSASRMASGSDTSSSDWYPTSEQEALAAGLTSYFVEPPPMPPVDVESNGVWVTVSWEEAFGPMPWTEIEIVPTDEEVLSESPTTWTGSGGFTPDALDANTPTSQSTRGPTRKPKVGHKGKSGTFGMVWDTFPGGINASPPRTGYPISPFYVKIDGQPTGTRFDAPARPEFGAIASFFAQNFKKSGYKMSFGRNETHWTVSDISGSGGIFNSVNLGILITHGSYGETIDSQSVLNTYLWHSDGTYARLRDLSLGSPGADGLRWMTLFTCSSLRPDNVTSMINRGFMTSIITENLHLLLATETVIVETPRSGWNYATNLVAEQTIPDAWYNALRVSLAISSTNFPGGITDTVKTRVLGWDPCFGDSLHFYNDPDTSLGLKTLTRQVWP